MRRQKRNSFAKSLLDQESYRPHTVHVDLVKKLEAKGEQMMSNN
ncbi:hypothetical protein J2T20_002568 [Paenibacillus wynnii]|nr:hypothetical protein [Paenibacillus wynnii]